MHGTEIVKAKTEVLTVCICCCPGLHLFVPCHRLVVRIFICSFSQCVQIKANTPVLMCSVPGYDASSRVDDLAAEMGKQITSIAIG